MDDGGAEFARLVGTVLRRWWSQNSRPSPGEVEIAAFSRRLWDVVSERGLPRPLAAGEPGTAGGMSEPECAPLVARVVGDLPVSLFADPARQLIKTCLYPEFRICRDSFRETGSDGVCRRQQLSKSRGRVSGVHCVDCPHWTELEPGEHQRLLVAEWRGDAAEFLPNREIFLPEDFRALRQWLHAWVRSGPRTTDHCV